MGVTRTYTLKGDRDKVYSRVVKKMESESSLVKIGQSGRGVRRIGLYAICRVQKNAYMLYIL